MMRVQFFTPKSVAEQKKGFERSADELEDTIVDRLSLLTWGTDN